MFLNPNQESVYRQVIISKIVGVAIGVGCFLWLDEFVPGLEEHFKVRVGEFVTCQ